MSNYKTLKDSYEVYAFETKQRIYALEGQIDKLSKLNHSLGNDLQHFRATWFFQDGLKVTKLKDITLEDFEGLENRMTPLLLRIKGYIINKQIIAEKKQIQRNLRKELIEYRLFSKTIKILFKEAKRMIIEEGFVFHMPYDLYTVFIAYKTRKKRPLDRNATRLKKMELLSNGVSIYDKEENPEGEEYRVYHGELGHYMLFFKQRSFPNRKHYDHKIILGSHSVPKAMFGFINNLEDKTSLYLNLTKVKESNELSKPRENYIRFRQHS